MAFPKKEEPKKEAPKKEEPKKQPSQNDLARLGDLLSRLPVDGFVGMVSNSGLPRKEARELCDAFRQLKK